MKKNAATMQAAHSENSDLKILVCYYDSYGMPYTDDGVMFPIQAGKAISDRDLHIQGDNELNGQPCDNISDKNPTYSEFTALYWAWKNLKKLYPDVKYVGWTHYRRFFAFDKSKFFADRIFMPTSTIKDYRADAGKVASILEAGKIIVAKRNNLPIPIYLQYCQCHYSNDYRTLKKVIAEKFPDYYDSFVSFMEFNNKISFYCMFVMKYEDFEKYCEWLFAVLTEIEPEIPLQHYDPYQKRVLAFIAERLLNVYILKNRMNPEYMNVYFYDDIQSSAELNGRLGKAPRFLRDSVRFMRRVIRHFKRELIFRLSRYELRAPNMRVQKNSSLKPASPRGDLFFS